jgi:hypothetical protein
MCGRWDRFCWLQGKITSHVVKFTIRLQVGHVGQSIRQGEKPVNTTTTTTTTNNIIPYPDKLKYLTHPTFSIEHVKQVLESQTHALMAPISHMVRLEYPWAVNVA